MTEFFPLQSITNDVATLTFQQDSVYGLRYVTIDQAAPGTAEDAPGTPASMSLAATNPWKVTLRDTSVTSPPSDGSDGLCHISTSDLPNPLPDSVTLSGPPSNPNAFEAVWNVTNWTKPGTSFPNDEFQVILRGRMAGSDQFCTFELEATVTEASPRTSIYRMELRTSVQSPGTPPTEILAAPWYLGVLIANPMESAIVSVVGLAADVRLSDPDDGGGVPTHPGALSMQWMAYYDDADSDENLFFWGTRDVEHHIKPYIVYQEAENQGLCFGAQYYPPENLTTTGPVSIPFPVIVAAIKGRWYEATQFYRSWALAQSWVPTETAATDVDYSNAVRTADALSAVAPASCTPPPGFPPTIDSSGPLDLFGVGEYKLGNLKEKPINIGKQYATFAHWTPKWTEFQSFFFPDKVSPPAKILGRPWFWDFNSFEAKIGEWFPMRTEFIQGAPRGEPGLVWGPYFHPSAYDEKMDDYESKEKAVDEFGYPPITSIRRIPKYKDCEVDTKLIWVSHPLCYGTGSPAAYAGQVLSQFLKEFHGASPPSTGTDPAGLYLDEFHVRNHICFDPAHKDLQNGHAPGGGNYFVDGKRQFLAGIKAALKNFNADAFLWIEGVSEPFLPYVEICNLAYGSVGNVQVDGAEVVRVPLFQTVYNEYLRFASTVTVNVPGSFPGLNDSVFMLTARAAFARQVFEAGELSLGALLTPDSLDTVMSESSSFAETLVMLKQYVGTLQQQDAVDLIRFGQRLREPESDVASVSFPGFGKTKSPLSGPKSGLGATESVPVVYQSAYGEYGDRVALLFVNWTAKEDEGLIREAGSLPIAKRSGPPPTAGVPDLGPQELTVTLDLGKWGFPWGNYNLIEPDGSVIPLDYTLGDLIDHPVVVPERSAQLYVIEPASSPLLKPEPERHRHAHPSHGADAKRRAGRRKR